MAALNVLSVFFVFMMILRSESSFFSDWSRDDTYRGAVYQHTPIVNGKNSEDIMMANVRVYAEQAEMAAQQGSLLIVFPEYGITGPNIHNQGRKFADDFHQEVPSTPSWNPCAERLSLRIKTKILHELSCISRKNSIAMVANLITRVPCDQTISNCPADDQLFFNTNVIFDREGTLVGIYHKRHLFQEKGIDPSPTAEITIVDLGFVKLGTLTCFDLVFADPLLDLVINKRIKNIALPSAWVDELPFALSVQMFSSFAQGLGINILAANQYNPSGGSLGSGIYSSRRGALNETYDLANPSPLLIADIPHPDPVDKSLIPSIKSTFESVFHFRKLINECPQATSYTAYSYVFTDLPSTKPMNNIHKIWIETFSKKALVHLDGPSGSRTTCQDNVCCQADYQFENVPKNPNTSYAVFAYRGMHGQRPDAYFIEICAVLRCEPANSEKCGMLPEGQTDIQFQKLSISGNFTTPYMYPDVLSTKLNEIPPNVWKFSESRCLLNDGYCNTNSQLEITTKPKESILAARIMARDYEMDKCGL